MAKSSLADAIFSFFASDRELRASPLVVMVQRDESTSEPTCKFQGNHVEKSVKLSATYPRARFDPEFIEAKLALLDSLFFMFIFYFFFLPLFLSFPSRSVTNARAFAINVIKMCGPDRRYYKSKTRSGKLSYDRQ